MQRSAHLGRTAATALAVLAGCAGPGDGGLHQPPPAKPATLPLQLEGPTADTSVLAGLSTKSGELMILESDGSVTRTRLDSARGREVLGDEGGAMLALSDVIVEDSSVMPENLPRPKRAQEKALEEFAGRSRPALPSRIVPTPPQAFLGGSVVLLREPVRRGGAQPATQAGMAAGDLVAVRVSLTRGVDDSAAFAYANCTLAAWSQGSKTPYARHIRTTTTESAGKRQVESIFTMSRTAPPGLLVMEREQTLRDCRAHGIPARVTAGGPVKGTEENG